MARFQFTPEAAGDLFEIWNYISKDNPEAADRVEEAVLKACSYSPILHSPAAFGKI